MVRPFVGGSRLPADIGLPGRRLLGISERCIPSRDRRGMAQPGSAAVLGTAGRRFESCCPDQISPDIQSLILS